MRWLGSHPIDRRFIGLLPGSNDFTTDCDRMLFGRCQIIRRSGDTGVHLRSAEVLNGNFFACRCLHERWPAKEYSPGISNDDIIVTEGRNISSACRTVPHHQGKLHNSRLREDRLVPENATCMIAVGKEMSLEWKKATGRITDVNNRQTVFDSDIKCTDDLFDRQGIPSAAFD